jgi:uncharacterized repeat protein (TIGR01451 family)
MTATASSSSSNGRYREIHAVASATGASTAHEDDGVASGFDGVKPLRLSVTTDRRTVAVGGTLTYTLRFSNASLSGVDPQVTGSSLEASVPPGTTLIAADGGVETQDNTVRWDLGALPLRHSSLRRFSVRVDAPVAALVSDIAFEDNTGRIASARRETAVGLTSPLEVTLTATPGPVLSGEPISQAVTVRNVGLTTLDTVQLQLQQPASTNSVPVLTGTASCSGSCSANEFATWALGSLSSGSSQDQGMTAVVSSGVQEGRFLELNALADAAGTSSVLRQASVLVGTNFVEPGPHPPVATLRLFGDGFE